MLLQDSDGTSNSEWLCAEVADFADFETLTAQPAFEALVLAVDSIVF